MESIIGTPTPLPSCESAGCTNIATKQVEGVAHAVNEIFPGSLTSVQHVAWACNDHADELELAMLGKAQAQLARDIPIHQEMHRLQGERGELYTALKDAVVARDDYLAANSTTEY